MKERLENIETLRVDTETKIPLKYRGRRFHGFAGDSVATALYANKVRIFSRSL